MAEATVFIDDAVLGHLPGVCVKDGVPTADVLTIAQDVDSRTGLGVAWLLILAGPLGWLGLFVIASMQRGLLTVTLPFSEAAYTRLRRAKGRRRQAGLLLIAAVVGALLSLLLRTTDGNLLAIGLGLVAVAALLKVIVESYRFNRSGIGLSLDASRRWVTVSKVHPDFVEAVSLRHRQQPGVRPSEIDV